MLNKYKFMLLGVSVFSFVAMSALNAQNDDIADGNDREEIDLYDRNKEQLDFKPYYNYEADRSRGDIYNENYNQFYYPTNTFPDSDYYYDYDYGY